MKHHLTTTRLNYLFGLIFLVISLYPLSAYSAAITMEYSIGFNGIFSINRWTPVNVILENKGRTINGVLELVVTSGNEYRRDVHDTIYSMDVELPTDSKKLYSLTAFIDSFTHPLIIRFKQGAKTIVSYAINLRSHYTSKELILAVGGDMAPDFLSKPSQDIFPVVTHAIFLPETWYGYDGVKMVVLHASAWNNLREKQFIALSEWIKKGGYLVTASGFNYGAFLEGRTRRLLPITILGFDRINRLNSLEPFCGRALTSTKPFLIIRARIDASEVLAAQEDIPVVIQKKIGMGKIVFLAFDYQTPPFTDWPGRHVFWNKMLDLRPSPEQTGADLEEKNILDAMMSSIPNRFPNYRWVIPFLALYVFLMYFVLNGLEKKHRHRWKYLSSLIAVIVVFSAVSAWAFLYTGASKGPAFNSFLHLKKSEIKGITSSRLIVGLYSLQSREYRFNLGETPYPVKALYSNLDKGEKFRSLVLHENSQGQSVLISLNRWSYRFFTLHSLINFPVQGKAFMTDQGLVSVIENMTSQLITDCQAYYRGRFFFFGDIAPDKKIVKKLASSALNKSGLFPDRSIEAIIARIGDKKSSPLLKKIQKRLMQDLLFSIHDRYQSKPETLHLFGWIESNVIPVHLANNDAARQDVTLLEWDIPIHKSGEKIGALLMPAQYLRTAAR